MKRISFLIFILTLSGCSALHKQNIYHPLANKHIYLSVHGGDHSMIYTEVASLLEQEGFIVDTEYTHRKTGPAPQYGVGFSYTYSGQLGYFRTAGKVFGDHAGDRKVIAEYLFETDKATMTPVFESGRGEKVASLIVDLWSQGAQ